MRGQYNKPKLIYYTLSSRVNLIYLGVTNRV
jgi:hypothetical protein